jgi:DNA-binding beta-propeller fold protein YncE/thiol-disulfide isomerase/thioredoxin
MTVERPLVRAPELAGAGGWINTAEPLSLAKLRGKVVLLDFWTFCCINCLHIIEELRPIEAAFPTELVVVGVHSPKFPEEQDHAAVERAVARHKIMHPVLDDPDMITWRRYGIRAWPSLILIDPRGYARWGTSGEGHGPQIMAAVRALIDEARANGSFVEGPLVRAAGVAATHQVAPAGSALAFPGKVASDGGARLAIADTGNDRVLIAGLDGAVERELGGLSQPQGVLFDTGANRLIVCNTVADEVLAFDLTSGERTRLAAGISSPWDVAPWQGGVAVAEAGRHRLWWIAPDGTASVLAGTSGENIVDGPALDALLAQPSGLSLGPDGALYVADSEVSALRRLRDGRIETLIGQGLFEWGADDGDRETGRLQHPLGVAAAPDGTVYIADTFNSLLRAWQGGTLRTLPVTGLDEPGGLCLLPDDRLAVADTNNHRIVLVDPATGGLTPLPVAGAAGAGADADAGRGEPRTLPERGRVTVVADLDLMGDDLDARDGPPVRVSVTADPPGLLGPGPRVWAEESLPVRIELRTGAGEGEITVDVQAASCLGDECRLHRRRAALPVRLQPGVATAELVV